MWPRRSNRPATSPGARQTISTSTRSMPNLIGAMCKINVTEAMVDCVSKCMQIVGVNSLSTEYKFRKISARGGRAADL